MTVAPPKTLLGLTLQELTEVMLELEQPAYRAKQCFEALYIQRIDSIDQISTLPQNLRERLIQEGFSVGSAKIERKFLSKDGTVRYLMGFADSQSVETVWMPEGDGGEKGDGSDAGDPTKLLWSGVGGAARSASPARSAAPWIVSFA